MKPLITCKEMNDFLMDYVEGALPDSQRTEFHRHLAHCPSCVQYVETYKTTIAAGKAAFCDPNQPDKLPEAVPESLISAILAARKKPAK